MVKETNYSGIGFFGLLTILFVGLKLTGYISWNWEWVLSPIWIPIIVLLILIVLILTFKKIFAH